MIGRTNASTKSGGNGSILVQSTAPEGNANVLWIDTGHGGIAKYWNGTAWTTVKAIWG